MVDGVRDVPFAHEAGANGARERQLEVEHLHGDALLVPVRRGVHDRHAADPDDAVETVLPLQDLPDTLVGALGDLVLRAHGQMRMA